MWEELELPWSPVAILPLSVPDAISSTNPRVIDDSRARKLSSDLKRCTYYETCATYGLNVERVFQDGKYPAVSTEPLSHAAGPLSTRVAELASDLWALGSDPSTASVG